LARRLHTGHREGLFVSDLHEAPKELGRSSWRSTADAVGGFIVTPIKMKLQAPQKVITSCGTVEAKKAKDSRFGKGFKGSEDHYL
jgi:hypothetical protein